MLTVDERAVLFYFCLNHAVARCLACARSFQLSELTADLLSGRTHLCPQCRRDLTDNVRSHLYGCAVLPAEVRQKAQTLREAARHLVKESRQLRGRADVLASHPAPERVLSRQSRGGVVCRAGASPADSPALSVGRTARAGPQLGGSRCLRGGHGRCAEEPALPRA